MERVIKLQKNNANRDWDDIEWLWEFYDFLQGEIPEEIKCTPLSLTKDQAFLIIWYLQEHFPVFPDQIDKCDVCGSLYDSYNEGYYSEEANEYGNHFCNACDHLAPYDNV